MRTHHEVEPLDGDELELLHDTMICLDTGWSFEDVESLTLGQREAVQAVRTRQGDIMEYWRKVRQNDG